MSDLVEVRLLFVDYGSYREETVRISRAAIAKYDRLIDCLREEPSVLEKIHVDVGRLAAAHVAEEEA